MQPQAALTAGDAAAASGAAEALGSGSLKRLVVAAALFAAGNYYGFETSRLAIVVEGFVVVAGAEEATAAVAAVESVGYFGSVAILEYHHHHSKAGH